MIVIADKKNKDKYFKQYLSLINKKVTNNIIDFRDVKIEDLKKYKSILVLEPMNEDFRELMKWYFSFYPEKDIEGSYTDKLTITAEAIIEVLPENIIGKSIFIINQSPILGIPLAHELMKRKANVFSINSKYKTLETHLNDLKPDILITATGNNNFKLKSSLTKNINLIIDLSDDCEEKNKISSVPTIKVLKKRKKSYK